MPKSQSSKRWLDEYRSDIYVKKAAVEGYRARSAYKLLEIQKKDRILQEGMSIVDLGSAPGSWSQVAKACVGERGIVFALDVLPMAPIVGVEFLQGDFTDNKVLDAFLGLLEKNMQNTKVDVVMSDIAPNMSGHKTVDQLSMMGLLELALDFAHKMLKEGGTFLAKAFHGKEYDAYLRNIRPLFEKVVVRKPMASRARSREVYILARGFKGMN